MSTEKIHDWKTAKDNGDYGEGLFTSLYSHIEGFERLDGRAADFRIRDILIELKTDGHCKDHNDSIFVETISNTTKNTPGAIFRAQADGCKYIVYLYRHRNILYWYRVDELVEYVKTNQTKYRTLYVQNYYYQTAGIILNHKDIQHCLAQIHTIQPDGKLNIQVF